MGLLREVEEGKVHRKGIQGFGAMRSPAGGTGEAGVDLEADQTPAAERVATGEYQGVSLATLVHVRAHWTRQCPFHHASCQLSNARHMEKKRRRVRRKERKGGIEGREARSDGRREEEKRDREAQAYRQREKQTRVRQRGRESDKHRETDRERENRTDG